MLPKTVAPLLALGSASLVFAQNPVAVTGVLVKNGAAPIRRNINDLAKEAGPQWDLYIQSLSAMYEVKSTDALSFFQVAGIHGWPFVEWNGTGAGQNNNDWNGYCPHGEPLFLSWHRPYVALFEQILVEHARQIAAAYPKDRLSEYTQAAETLRAPFWDWASARAVPEATVPESVTINTAEGQKQVENPLATYKYPQEAIQGQYGDMNRIRPEAGQQPQTYRCPSPQSYPKSANEALSLTKNQVRTNDLRAMVYDVFTNSQTFSQFASTRNRGFSLEQIHNSIHVEAACRSDFLNQFVAGFDVLFMLHHANVDRLWAYWQAIHPEEANLSGSYSGGARFTTSRGTSISLNSPLEPFHGQDGEPHTSKTVASIRDFGYSYEGLEEGKSDQETRNEAVRLINRLYSGNSPPEPPSSSGNPDRPGPGNGPDSTRPGNNTGPKNGTRPGISPSGSPNDPRPSNNPNNPRPGNSPNGPRPGDNSPPGANNTLPGTRPSGNPKSPRPSNSPTGPGFPTSSNNPNSSGFPNSGSNPNGPGFPNSEDNPNGPGFPPSDNGLNGSGDNGGIDSNQRQYAYVQLEVEQVERPCFVNIYVGDNHAGSMVVMSQPARGIFNGAVFLNGAIDKFGSQASNSTSREFNNNIYIDITKPDGQRIDLSSVASLKVEVSQITVTPPTSDHQFPAVEIKDPEPVNGGRELMPPPSSAQTEYGPRIDGGGNSEGSGSGTGGGGKKPENERSSAVATFVSHLFFASAPLAVSGLLAVL
ncbi:tyrosinase [Hirsutella rhossiliensis]|uniref:Tyrosinase n=1 Tax=Hirsutella rhossiliensis TaxID=111463 RepID=A0A9P8MT67_9HYPO|nr:tyrosinase [Hirsutella rhossiliensis]KAH0959969.1 tyrosinase [Hirsutella rhossiliensis]